MLRIDHLAGPIEWMHSAPKKDVIRNTLVLAKAAIGLDMPVILTSSQEDQVQGPLIPELREILPQAYERRVKRGASWTPSTIPTSPKPWRAAGART